MPLLSFYPPSSNNLSSLRASRLSLRSCRSISWLMRFCSLASSERQHAIILPQPSCSNSCSLQLQRKLQLATATTAYIIRHHLLPHRLLTPWCWCCYLFRRPHNALKMARTRGRLHWRHTKTLTHTQSADSQYADRGMVCVTTVTATWNTH